jgi:hypothetical protein
LALHVCASPERMMRWLEYLEQSGGLLILFAENRADRALVDTH